MKLKIADYWLMWLTDCLCVLADLLVLIFGKQNTDRARNGCKEGEKKVKKNPKQPEITKSLNEDLGNNCQIQVFIAIFILKL